MDAKEKPQERSRKCNEKVVERTGDTRRVWFWHAQWGGYCGHAYADFHEYTGSAEGSPGCFNVSVYHDGHFPTEEVSFCRHYCDALQLVEMGLDVYEAQVEHQKRDVSGQTNNPDLAEPAPLRLDRKQLSGSRGGSRSC